MLTNFILCAAVLNVGGFQNVDTNADAGASNGTIYMGVVLWSVAGLSLFRFIGACWFLVVRIVSQIPFVEMMHLLMSYSSAVYNLQNIALGGGDSTKGNGSGVTISDMKLIELCMACGVVLFSYLHGA